MRLLVVRRQADQGGMSRTKLLGALALTVATISLPTAPATAATKTDAKGERAGLRVPGKQGTRKASRACRRAPRACVRRVARKKVAPDTTITAGPANGSTSTSSTASFSFLASVAGSTFTCSLDGAAYVACTSPTSRTGLANGAHTFRVRASSGGQTDSTPASVSWTVQTTTTAPAPAPTPTPTPAPAPAPAPAPTVAPRTTWTPVGTLPLSDADAAARVTRRPETRSENVTANSYVPTAAEISAYQNATNAWGEPNLQTNPLSRYVTGRPGIANPSTDDLIQWTAHKWGIPEDWIRAQMAHESWWKQPALGDRTTVSAAWYALYPAHARIAGTTDVMQSMGVMQVRWAPDGGPHPGTDPLRWKSTAFNLDYYGATTRYYYDGRCTWCTTGYSAGQAWNSIGAWNSPHPWNNTNAQAYVATTQRYLEQRVWAQAGF